MSCCLEPWSYGGDQRLTLRVLGYLHERTTLSSNVEAAVIPGIPVHLTMKGHLARRGTLPSDVVRKTGLGTFVVWCCQRDHALPHP